MIFEENKKLHEKTKLYPEMVLAAMKLNFGARYRFFSLAKHLNKSGSGKINIEVFKSFLFNHVGIHQSSFYRWLAESSDIELMKREKNSLILAGYKYAASLVGCFNLGRPVYIDLCQLFSKDWHAWVWAGYLKGEGLEHRPLSRSFLRKQTGIPERTQREYHKQANIGCQPNYAKNPEMAGSKEMIIGINEFERDQIKSKAFLHNGEIWWRLPNNYVVPGIQRGSRISSQRINRQLSNLKKDGGWDSKVEPVFRLYCEKEWQLDALRKIMQRQSENGNSKLPVFIYLRSKSKGVFHVGTFI